MIKVLHTPEVQDFYYELENILFEKGYFSYKETSNKYVADLLNGIKTNLPNVRHRRAPKCYAKYGKDLHYASFKKNKRTTWYAFFTKYEENGDTIYLVRYIGTNHTEAHHLYEEIERSKN